MSRFIVALCIMISCTFSQDIEASESETIQFIINECDSKIILDYENTNEDAIPILDEIEYRLNQGAFRSFLSTESNDDLYRTNHGKLYRVMEYRKSIAVLLALENQEKKEVLENSISIWYLPEYQNEERQFIYHSFHYDGTKVLEGLMIPSEETPLYNFLDNKNIEKVLENNNIKESEDLYRISFREIGARLVVFRCGNERLCIPYMMHAEEFDIKNENVYPFDEVLVKLQAHIHKKRKKREFFNLLPHIARIFVSIVLLVVIIKVIKTKRLTKKAN